MDVYTGLARKLPPMPDEDIQQDSQILAKNIYYIKLQRSIMAEGELMDISQLRAGARAFINNNGRDLNYLIIHKKPLSRYKTIETLLMICT